MDETFDRLTQGNNQKDTDQYLNTDDRKGNYDYGKVVRADIGGTMAEEIGTIG